MPQRQKGRMRRLVVLSGRPARLFTPRMVRQPRLINLATLTELRSQRRPLPALKNGGSKVYRAGSSPWGCDWILTRIRYSRQVNLFDQPSWAPIAARRGPRVRLRWRVSESCSAEQAGVKPDEEVA